MASLNGREGGKGTLCEALKLAWIGIDKDSKKNLDMKTFFGLNPQILSLQLKNVLTKREKQTRNFLRIFSRII